MRVIAIRDSRFNDGVKQTSIAIHKGSVYHVVNKVFSPKEYRFQDTGNHYPNGVWFYELLEQEGYHVEDIFLEIPKDEIKEELYELETNNN